MKFTRVGRMVLLLLLSVDTQAVGQRRDAQTHAGPAKPAGQRPSAERATAEKVANGYWAAQRSIAAAVQQLEGYLRDSPEGERASTARQQLAVLRSLTEAASRPAWAPMGRLTLREVPEWRVTSVEPEADRVRLYMEVTCRREDGGSCFFRPFDRFPLVLVDDAGHYYPMLGTGDLPPDIRQRERDERFAISGGRAITIRVDFAPLAAGVISGQVYYRDENQAMPARFSIISRK